MSPSDILRLVVPSNPLLSITLLLCFFNYLLLLLNSNFHQATCHDGISWAQESTRQKRSANNDVSHWNVQERNQYWSVEIAKYSTFNWENEMERIFKIIPVIEMRTAGGGGAIDEAKQIFIDPDDPAQWGQELTKSRNLPLVTERTSDDLVAQEVKRINSNFMNIYQGKKEAKGNNWSALMKEVLADGLLGCEEISKLESNRNYPKIKFKFRSFSKWKGEIQISTENNFPILLRNFVKKARPPESNIEKMNYVSLARKNEKPYFDKSFERAKNEVLNLLKMQGWYGIPRLYGLCLTSSNGDDVIKSILKDQQRKSSNKIRYIVSRQTHGTQLCDSYHASFECQRLHPVMRIINSMDKPHLAALTLMYNTAALFEQFWYNGAVLYDLIGTDFYIDENLDVMITDISSVKFLPRNNYSENSRVQRLLSGTICTESSQCETVSWQSNSISRKLGLHCQEVRGHCTRENRCWGIDSHVHACVLSRWFFLKLHSAIPTSWARDDDLSNLIQCGSKNAPDERCDWTQLRSGLEQLHEIAKKEWGT